MTKYAPILLFVYNRPEHLKQTMETLQNNTLAAESELYIYSDAARKDTDEAAVAEVRNYIHKITGFKSITLIEREKVTFTALVPALLGHFTLRDCHL